MVWGAKRVFGIETEYWITIDGVDARGAARGREAGHALPPHSPPLRAGVGRPGTLPRFPDPEEMKVYGSDKDVK